MKNWAFTAQFFNTQPHDLINMLNSSHVLNEGQA